jgi:amino acid transporter, AAT family
VLLRTLISIAAAIVLYIVYYKTAHLFLGTQKGFSHPQQFPMIPMIWLINIFLINFWFMDGWPGWRLSPVSESEVAEEATESWSWNPPLAWGVVSGLVIGVVVYVLTINLLPWIGQHFTIIK